MNAKRRAAILGSLNAGHKIRRQWNGPNQGGYLQYLLEGVLRLRESEVEELEKEGLLFLETGRAGSFGSYRLRTPQDEENAAKRQAELQAVLAQQQREKEERDNRIMELHTRILRGTPDVYAVSATDYNLIEFQGRQFRITER